MKADYRQIHHIKIGGEWKALPYPGARVRLHPEDAAVKNNHFEENGVRVVPNNEWEKYLKNARLLN